MMAGTPNERRIIFIRGADASSESLVECINSDNGNGVSFFIDAGYMDAESEPSEVFYRLAQEFVRKHASENDKLIGSMKQ